MNSAAALAFEEVRTPYLLGAKIAYKIWKCVPTKRNREMNAHSKKHLYHLRFCEIKYVCTKGQIENEVQKHLFCHMPHRLSLRDNR